MRVVVIKENIFAAEEELLHKQFKMLAEKSKDCSTDELIALTEQMVKIYSVLNQLCY